MLRWQSGLSPPLHSVCLHALHSNRAMIRVQRSQRWSQGGRDAAEKVAASLDALSRRGA